jgi:hypothetical protein
MALELALRLGALAAQLGQSRDEDLGIGQQPLAHPARERRVLDRLEPLQPGIVLQAGLRVGALQVRHRHLALEGRQLAALDPALQRAAAHAHQARRSRQCQ